MMCPLQIDRSAAIEILVADELERISVEERENLLLDWWSIGTDAPGFAELPQALKDKIALGESPEDVADPLYTPLVKLAIQHAYVGVVNSFLQRRLFDRGDDVTVVGQVEHLEACPCCGYCTLELRANYEICPVCFWEDDGTDEPDRYSPPNHLTLQQARVNFERIGAVTEGAKNFVLQDGTLRFNCSKPRYD